MLKRIQKIIEKEFPDAEFKTKSFKDKSIGAKILYEKDKWFGFRCPKEESLQQLAQILACKHLEDKIRNDTCTYADFLPARYHYAKKYAEQFPKRS